MENLYKLSFEDIALLLNAKAMQYNKPDFIQSDPISIPHKFKKKQDIEIIALIMSLIAWGKRKMIIDNGEKLIEIMGNAPYEFVRNYETGMLQKKDFVHRTFNGQDLDFILQALKKCYKENDSLEKWFYLNEGEQGVKYRIINFRSEMLKTNHEKRSEKHLANPAKGSAAKRINMFLRWMVRKDNSGVDFGIWSKIPMHELYVPLDVHTGNVGRLLGLIKRKQNDWKALEELMKQLQKINPNDPCKFDYALFCMGVNKDLEELENYTL